MLTGSVRHLLVITGQTTVALMLCAQLTAASGGRGTGTAAMVFSIRAVLLVAIVSVFGLAVSRLGGPVFIHYGVCRTVIFRLMQSCHYRYSLYCHQYA